jgi:hypothetical protein
MRVRRDKEEAKVPKGSARKANTCMQTRLILKAPEHSATETGLNQWATAAAVDSGPLRKMRVASPRSTR